MSIDTLASGELRDSPVDHVYFLPAYHPRSERTCLPHCANAASHIDELFDAIYMHFSDCNVTLSILRGLIRVVPRLQGVSIYE